MTLSNDLNYPRVQGGALLHNSTGGTLTLDKYSLCRSS